MKVMREVREMRWDGEGGEEGYGEEDEDSEEGGKELECEGGQEDEGLMNGNEQNIIDMWSCNQPMSSITKVIICCLL